MSLLLSSGHHWEPPPSASTVVFNLKMTKNPSKALFAGWNTSNKGINTRVQESGFHIIR
jgi:hypothetical protein